MVSEENFIEDVWDSKRIVIGIFLLFIAVAVVLVYTHIISFEQPS